MLLAAVATVLLAPLALAPHLFYYYDITPKVALLLLGAAIALALASRELDSLRAFCGTRYGRWYASAAGAAIALAGIATVYSAHPALAWDGSNWRRMGGLSECAVVLAALGIAAYTLRSPERLGWLLRAMCAAGLLTSLYGIAQYFGFDPLLPKAGYEAGEGIFRIVRPPGTLGHSDYFAAFLLWPVFAGIGLWQAGSWSRPLAFLASACGIIAILLSGSRGAVAALFLGACVLAVMLRPNARVVAGAAALAALALGAFYFSPAGQRLRARVHWIAEDRLGGARLLLWRDSLRMAGAKPLTGFGPDTFVAEFPQFQSEDLARAYPEFSHESPHNILLDALTAEGVPGVLVLIVVAVAGMMGALSAQPWNSVLTVALLPGFAAGLVAHQFIVFTAPTAFYFYLVAGVLAGAGASSSPVFRAPFVWRWVVLAGGLAAAGFFTVMVYRLVAADFGLAEVQRRLDANDAHGAADAYRRALSHHAAGVTADLDLSRRWAAVALHASDPMSRLYYGQVAAGAASRATKSPEQQPNAWYNLAMFEASANDARAVEYSLRAAIAAAPVWYKPHWALARLLAQEGRLPEAVPEARRALYLDGGKDVEVVSTVNEILSSAGARP